MSSCVSFITPSCWLSSHKATTFHLEILFLGSSWLHSHVQAVFLIPPMFLFCREHLVTYLHNHFFLLSSSITDLISSFLCLSLVTSSLRLTHSTLLLFTCSTAQNNSWTKIFSWIELHFWYTSVFVKHLLNSFLTLLKSKQRWRSPYWNSWRAALFARVKTSTLSVVFLTRRHLWPSGNSRTSHCRIMKWTWSRLRANYTASYSEGSPRLTRELSLSQWETTLPLLL